MALPNEIAALIETFAAHVYQLYDLTHEEIAVVEGST